MLTASGGALTILVPVDQEEAWISVASSSIALHAARSAQLDQSSLQPLNPDDAVSRLCGASCAGVPVTGGGAVKTLIAVYTTRAGQTSTHWAVCLAWTLAERARVLLVDCDMEGGTIADLLLLRTEDRGIANCFGDRAATAARAGGAGGDPPRARLPAGRPGPVAKLRVRGERVPAGSSPPRSPVPTRTW